MADDKDTKIEYVSGATESTDSQLYSASPAPVVIKEQTALSIIGLILAFPFPIIIIILWVTLHVIKQQNQALGEGTMTAVFLYFLQFFVVPIFSLTSVIIGFIVTLKSKEIAKKIGYISFGITGIGLLILGLFLNNT
jgi:hypothetical protein